MVSSWRICKRVHDRMINEFNRVIEIDNWEFLWCTSNRISSCYQVKESIFKIHTRWYKTPEKLKRINPKFPKTCWKCHENEGTMYHQWWGCKKAKKYWNMMHENIVKVLGYEIVKLPELYLLGLKMENIPTSDRTVLWYIILAARILYAKFWKDEATPELYEWKTKVIYISKMDKYKEAKRECENGL